tara:strand:- start:5786 stop:6520 length:735 start_codon:yes stop_codon:yes gene_type:complete
MKEVLVVSDNVRLVKCFKETVKIKSLTDIASFDYRYSSKNENPTELVRMGMGSVNLKDPKTCEYVLKKYDLILSIHCKQIFPKILTENILCVNFHPGFNPFNRGWYPQVFSIINKKPTGVTVHVMDEFVDHGKIIDQKAVMVYPEDTSLTVYERVISLEEKLISKNIRSIILGTFKTSLIEDEGNYNSVEDFRKLCQLDLDAVGTLREHIDLLRALTHGEFKNAYYYEEGKKLNISITLSEAQT